MQQPVTEDVIKSKLSSGEFVLKPFSERKCKCWEHFNLIIDKKNEKKQGFVLCTQCKTYLKYDDSRETNSSLDNHQCATNDRKLVSETALDQKQNVPLSEELKNKIVNSCVNFCFKNIKLETFKDEELEILKDETFLILAQNLISAGAVYGHHVTNDILSLITTKTVDAVRKRKNLISNVKKVIINPWSSAKINMWTDDLFVSFSHISITLRCFTENWDLRGIVLGPMSFQEKHKSGENIKNKVVKEMENFEIEELMSKLILVTDQDPNIVKAFQDYNRLNCLSHIINTILHHTFNEDYLKEKLPEIQRVIQLLSNFEKLLKECEFSKNLYYRIQKLETRWDSKFVILKSILDNYNRIQNLRAEEKFPHLKNIPKDNIEDLVDFLMVFKDALDTLEKKHSPTIHLVLRVKLYLQNQLKVSEQDSVNLKTLKIRANKFLNDEYQILPIHQISLFLWPRFRQLEMLTSNERKDVIERIDKEIKGQCIENSNITDEPERACSAPKRRKILKFDEWENIGLNDKSSGPVVCEEIKDYINYKVSKQSNIIEFWKTNQSKFPRLAKLAKKYLSVPASTSFLTEEIKLSYRKGIEEAVKYLLLQSNSTANGSNKPSIPSTSTGSEELQKIEPSLP